MSIIITINELDEYEVPAGINSDGEPETYYTTCQYDAFDTARAIHGILADIIFEASP